MKTRLPQRVRASRQHPEPPHTLRCTRPSKWGNPWRVGGAVQDVDREWLRVLGYDPNAKILTREMCLALYRQWLDYRLRTEPEKYDLAALYQYDYLSCFCKLTEACHVDIILGYMAAIEPPELLSRQLGLLKG